MSPTFTRAMVIAGALAMCSLPALAQSGGVSGQAESGATSPKEMLDFTRNALSEMDDASKEVSKIMEAAEREGDKDKIGCVSGKLASIKALREVSARASDGMSDALADDNAQLAEHEFRKVAVAISKVRSFVAEAEACVGEAGSMDGVTEVEVSGAEDQDGDETSPLLDGGEVVGDDPISTSPFE